MNGHEFFQHTDGGFYRFSTISKSTVDQSEWVIYEHVWPFEAQTWHRPLEEWASRFTPVDLRVISEASMKDRVLAQAEILHKRQIRKAKEEK